jgi:pimeloyl-ACP methyl ester carboxylesterase
MLANAVVMKGRRSLLQRLALILPGFLALLVLLLLGSGVETAHAATTNNPPIPRGFTDGFVHTDGIRIHYVQGGHGAPVVLLHGFPENWYEWHSVMPALAQRYHVIAIDMRGAGQSDAPATGYDKETLAKDVHGVVQQLHLGSINLVGHDIGLMVAYAYAATYPTEVRHLVLMEAPIPDSSVYSFPALSANGPGLWWFGLFNTPSMAKALLQGREAQFITDFFKSSVPPVVANSITSEDKITYTNDLRGPDHLNAYISYFSTLPQDITYNKQHLLQKKLTMPVLAMGADHSIGAGVGDQVAQYATNVKKVVVANSGHWIPEEHPQVVIQNLLSFFGA